MWLLTPTLLVLMSNMFQATNQPISGTYNQYIIFLIFAIQYQFGPWPGTPWALRAAAEPTHAEQQPHWCCIIHSFVSQGTGTERSILVTFHSTASRMISFFPLEAIGELHKEHLQLESQSHAKLAAPWVYCSRWCHSCVCPAPGAWQGHHCSHPLKAQPAPLLLLLALLFPRNNSGNTGTSKWSI